MSASLERSHGAGSRIDNSVGATAKLGGKCGTEGRRATLLANECRTRLRLAPGPSMIAIPPPPRTATPRSSLPLATIVLWFVAWPTRAPAQLYAGLDGAFASRYVWRGGTRVDGAALQPEGGLRLPPDGRY